MAPAPGFVGLTAGPHHTIGAGPAGERGMCPLVMLRGPDHPWPVVIGANRDEMIDRPSLPPGRHWPDRVEVTAGIDLLAGGSWLGINDWGVAAAILNRQGSLGPAA